MLRNPSRYHDQQSVCHHPRQHWQPHPVNHHHSYTVLTHHYPVGTWIQLLKQSVTWKGNRRWWTAERVREVYQHPVHAFHTARRVVQRVLMIRRTVHLRICHLDVIRSHHPFHPRLPPPQKWTVKSAAL